MREESGRSKVDLDEGATLDSFRSLLTDDSRSEIVIRENVGREGGDDGLGELGSTTMRTDLRLRCAFPT